jgi:copper homeostasis protein
VELLRRGFDLTLVRAFDPVPDIAPAIELAADLGLRRILTSGQAATAAEGRAGLER